MNVNAEVCL